MMKLYCDRCGKESPDLKKIGLSQLDKEERLIKKEVLVCDCCYSYIKRSLDSYNSVSNKMRVVFCETLMDCVKECEPK